MCEEINEYEEYVENDTASLYDGSIWEKPSLIGMCWKDLE
jgi:hypothetical protein